MQNSNQLSKETRHTCMKCGKKRLKSYMVQTNVLAKGSMLPRWECKNACEKTYYKGVISLQSDYRK